MEKKYIRITLSLILAAGMSALSYAATSSSAVGRIPGTFSTNSMGAALYNIPIQCPAGINNMQPTISLSYNSQAGNGIAGWGWTISGGSSIARIKRTSYYDGSNKEIDWSGADSLALDGVRLMPSIRYADSITYYLENDPTIMVRAYGTRNNNSPTHFKVFTKSGLTMTYGDAQNLSSHLLMYDNAAAGSGAVKAGWNLIRAEDAHGNFMKTDYLNVMGSLCGNVIRQITYGGNRAKKTEGNLIVYFEYEGRPDNVQNFISGKEVLMQLRLTRIVTKVDNTVQKNYRLSYQPGKITRLESLTLFDGNTQQYDPLVFSYGESKTSGSNIDISHIKNKDASNEKEKRVGLIALDRHGNGYSQLGDIFYESSDYSPAFGYGKCYIDMHEKKYNWASSYRSEIGVNLGNIPRAIPGLFADFNGNGSADKVNFYFETNVLGTKLKVRIEDQLILSPLCDAPLRTIKNTPFMATGTYFGNPLAGVLILYDQPEELANKTYKYSYDVVMSDLKSGYVAPYTNTNMSFVVPAKITYATTIKMGSINYYDDLFLLLEDGSARILKNSQSGAFCFSSTDLLKDTGLKLSKDDLFSFGDMNVDGLTDIIYRKGKSTWNIAFNKGNGKFLIKSIGTIYCDKDEFEDECDYIAIIDINNDNFPDIVVGDEMKNTLTYWRFYFNDGTGTFSIYYGEQSPEKAAYSCLADFHGNGTISWVHTSMNGKVLITDFGHGRYKNLLTKVENPISLALNIKYKPQAECKFMDGKDPIHAYTTPQKYLEIGYLPFKTSMMPIVSESSEDKIFIKYDYGNALLNWYHRGYAGFRFYQEYDSTHNVRSDVSTMMYRNEINYNSGTKYNLILPYETRKYIGRNSTTSFAYELSEYTIKNLGGKRFTMWESEYIRTDDPSNSFHKELRVCDNFNNITKLTVGSNTRKTVTETTYEKSGAWCLNVPKEEKVTEQFDSETLTKVRSYKNYLRGIPSEVNGDSQNGKNITVKNGNIDAFGHPTIVQRSATGEDHTRLTYYQYSECGRFIIKSSDELGQLSSYNWDKKRDLLLSDSTRLGVTRYEYDIFGELSSTTYPDGRISTQSTIWGAAIVCAASLNTKYSVKSTLSGAPPVYALYNSSGQEVAKMSKGVNEKSIYVFSEYQEKDGKLLRISKPTFRLVATANEWAETYEYDSYGRVNKVTTPAGIVSTTYSRKNENGEIYFYKTVTAPDSEIEIKYSGTGQLVQSTVNNKSVSFTHTIGGRIKTATPEGGTSVTFQYDRNGNRIRITDPNSSIINSEYDVWGNLIKEHQLVHAGSSGTGIDYKYSYGLLSEKRIAGAVTYYLYDEYKRLTSMRNSTSYKTFTYDQYDRIIETSIIVDGKTLTSKRDYDQYGQLVKETYPSGYYINNIYDSYGNLTSVTDRNGRKVWQLLTSDPEGRVLTEKKGTVTTTYRYNKLGQLDSICAPAVIDLRYTYYPTGNLKSFKDAICNQSETYVYDKLDRLTKWSNYYMNDRIYDSKNRITSLYDPANGYRDFQYNNDSKPNALTLSSGSKEILEHQLTYTDFKKVKTIQQGVYGYVFHYGPDEELVMKQKTLSGKLSFKQYYAENYEENPSHYFGNYHYIYGGNGLAAIYTNSNGGFFNAYTDILGSLIALTQDGSGTVRERHSFDPYGNRRDPSNWSQAGNYGYHLSYRGYTMHEHLYEVGLINMGSRVYDPYTSQFLSPDPQLQAPENWLNYNRYAYGMNNPLKYTDPDGEFFFTAILGPIGALIDAACWGSLIGGAGYTLSVAFSDGGFKNWSWNDFGKSVGVGAISGVATYGIGNMFGPVGGLGFSGEIGRAYTHGFAQGMISQVTGGDFMHGFSSGSLGSLASSSFMMYGGRFATSILGNYSFSGLSGGVGSVLSGGNFWEGTATALMTTGLNHLEQHMSKPSFEKLLANYPMDDSGNEMKAGAVYKMLGGDVLAAHEGNPDAYQNACALRVSKALNGSGEKIPRISRQTLKGADNKNYFYRAEDLYKWLTKKYGSANITTKNAASLKGNRGIYIMRASYPATFGAWGHSTLYNRTGTIGNGYVGPNAHNYNLWKF